MIIDVLLIYDFLDIEDRYYRLEGVCPFTNPAGNKYTIVPSQFTCHRLKKAGAARRVEVLAKSDARPCKPGNAC